MVAWVFFIFYNCDGRSALSPGTLRLARIRAYLDHYSCRTETSADADRTDSGRGGVWRKDVESIS